MAKRMSEVQIERQRQLARDRWNAMVHREEEQEHRDNERAEARRRRIRAV